MIGARTGVLPRVLGMLAFVAAVGVVFVLLLQAAGGVDLKSRYTIQVVVPTALQLAPNADVKERGVTVGKVRRISSRGTSAVLELALEKKYAPVHEDARVQVRLKTLVGENYVELNPGTPTRAEIPEGGRLAADRGRESVQLDDVLSTLDPARRRRVQRVMAELGRGVGDAKAVGAGVDGISSLLLAGKRLAVPIDQQRGALRSLVRNTRSTVEALADRGDEIERFVRASRQTAETVAAEQRVLRAGLAEIPPTLVSADRTADQLASVGHRADPVLADITVALDDLNPVLRRLPAASGSTLEALRELRRTARPARGLLTSLRDSAPSVAKVVPPLDLVLRDLRPVLSYASPYARDIGSGFGGLAQGVATRDSVSHIARLLPVVTPEMLPLLGADTRAGIEQLLGAGLARNLTFRGQNAIPEPNSFARPKAFTGSYPRVFRDPAPAGAVTRSCRSAKSTSLPCLAPPP